APPGPPPGVPLPPIATASADALDEVVAAARALPRGGRLLVEGLPLGPGGPRVALGLERVQVFAEDAEIVVHRAAGEDRLDPPDDAWMHGQLVGEGDSVVLLTVPEEGVPRGLLFRRGRFFVVGAEGSEPARGRGRLIAREGQIPPGGPFDCRLDEVTPPEDLVGTAPRDLFPHGEPSLGDSLFEEEGGGGRVGGFAASGATHTARVAVETDHELFQRFGGNRAALTAYVGDLFAYISTLYSREIGTSLEVSHLSIWDSPSDPWTQTSPSCGMYEFGRFWNNNRGSVDRTVAHFLSGKSTTAGIAWLGVLCRDGFTVDHGGSCPGLSPQRDVYGGGYGYTGGISGGFNPASPSLVWDVLGVAHEIGHNFDSPHTHCYGDIGGSSQPVDQCSASECGRPGCFCGTPTLPCGTAGAGCGTVMSYCHLLSGNLRNITFTFGQSHPFGVQPARVPARMRAHVLEAAAFDAACLALSPGGGTCENLTVSALTIGTAQSFSTCGTLFAGPSVRVTSSGDLTLTAGRVVLRNGFSVAAGGELVVRTVP
ncbi:MAG TPA: M12 family metallo-peptidase, partial [Thermoanaerobaculia bacterium]|nr:M12 family metallo-peptidase [Thermoanaerobaculia bacterium]